MPATGAVKACRGAVGRERRTQAVRIAESATARSAAPTKGKVSTKAVQHRQRLRGVAPGRPVRDRRELDPTGSNSNPVAAS